MGFGQHRWDRGDQKASVAPSIAGAGESRLAAGTQAFTQQLDDLALARKAARRMLRVDQLPVDADVENAFVALDELGRDAELVAELGCQTGSPR